MEETGLEGKVLYATDLHGRTDVYNRIFGYSIEKKIPSIILGGDITPWKTNYPLKIIVEMQADFLNNFLIPGIRKIKEEEGKEVFLMMGNDDARVNYRILEDAEKNGVLRLLSMHKVNEISGAPIIGYSFVPVSPFRLKDWEKFERSDKKIPLGCISIDSENAITTTGKKNEGSIEEDIAKIRKMSKPESTVYVMHSPPNNTSLDISGDGSHCGSYAIREFIEKDSPYLTLHGHIHESAKLSGKSVEWIGKTASVNPGALYKEGVFSGIAVIDLFNLKKIKFIKI
ncbi:MAG: metallophosphoesterase [Candidatus Woesearchaeota archaeon]|nr:metallophosphoesterase [Candidatus Woesearchaeota archaeon]